MGFSKNPMMDWFIHSLRISATPPRHPPNHYSCLLSIGMSWRYCCGRQASALSRYRCLSPLTSTCKTYAGTYGASVFYSAGCSFRSFVECSLRKISASVGCKRRMARRPHAVSKGKTYKTQASFTPR
jgi:hypothetical protein